MAGLSSTSGNFQGIAESSLNEADFSGSTNFALGVFYGTSFARGLGKLTLENELLFSQYTLEGSATIVNRVSQTRSISDIEVSLSYIKLNTMLRYKFHNGKVAWYVNGGISNGFIVSESSSERREIRVGNSSRFLDEVPIEDPRSYEQGLIAGVGAQFSPWGVELRLERSNGMLTGGGTEAVITKVFLLFSYDF